MKEIMRPVTVKLPDTVYWEMKKHVADKKLSMQAYIAGTLIKDMKVKK